MPRGGTAGDQLRVHASAIPRVPLAPFPTTWKKEQSFQRLALLSSNSENLLEPWSVLQTVGDKGLSVEGRDTLYSHTHHQTLRSWGRKCPQALLSLEMC